MDAPRLPAISRRALLARGAGVGLAALAATGAPAAAMPLPPDYRPALFVVERGMAGAPALIAEMSARTVPVVQFEGDVGDLWMEVVRPLWSQGPATVAGLTGPGARFCLEQLGRAVGLACTSGSGAVWLLRPVARA